MLQYFINLKYLKYTLLDQVEKVLFCTFEILLVMTYVAFQSKLRNILNMLFESLKNC